LVTSIRYRECQNCGRKPIDSPSPIARKGIPHGCGKVKNDDRCGKKLGVQAAFSTGRGFAAKKAFQAFFLDSLSKLFSTFSNTILAAV
jgi:hypothetical protein